MSLTVDILRSYRAPRRVMRDLLAAGPREDRALAFLIGACLLIFVAQWPRLARQAHLDDSVPFQVLLGGAMFGWLFLAPLAFYLLALLLQGGMRLTGRRVDGGRVRMALFWSLLAASPLWLGHGLLAGLLGPVVLSQLLGLALLAVFFWLAGSNLREAALEAGASRP